MLALPKDANVRQAVTEHLLWKETIQHALLHT
jgi:hypothetical protein